MQTRSVATHSERRSALTYLREILSGLERSDTRDAARALIEQVGPAQRSADAHLDEAITYLGEILTGRERSDTRDAAQALLERAA
jgi:hypothetical protein